MKKLLLLLFISISLVSCSEDDPVQIQSIDSMTGQWRQTAYKISNENDVIDMTGCASSIQPMLYTFNANGTFLSELACDETDTPDTFNYTYSNSNLTLISEPVVKIYHVTDIGDNSVKLTLTQTSTNGEIEDQSNSGNYSIFKKQ